MDVARISFVACVIICCGFSSAQQLVSRGKHITSISYVENKTADMAVDGDSRRAAKECQCCAATDFEYEPWYKLDLGQLYTIYKISVLGRGDGLYDQTLLNMEIKLGTTLSNGQVLTENTVSVFEYNYTLPTPLEGRYLTLTLRDLIQYFVICELMVYAECDPGTYGVNCSEDCGHCFANDQCDTVDGICSAGCNAGFEGPLCKDRCQAGKFGEDCASDCGHCFQGEPCDAVTGICPHNCSDGYIGLYCKQRCQAGKFGKDCASDCGHCFQGEPCDVVTGICPHNCSVGYIGLYCTQECADGTFGMGCNEYCGKCLDGETCDKRNGACSKCEPGYVEPLCRVSQNVGRQTECPIYTSFQLEIVIGGTIAVVLIIEAIVAIICCGIRKRRRVRKRKKPTLAISGPYEMTGRFGCYTEHPYGQRPVTNIYEEPGSPYETTG